MTIRLSLLLILIASASFFSCAQTPTPEPELKFLALGDSYTIGESVAESERWPVILARELNLEGYRVGAPKIIARTGWRTDNLMAAIEAEALQPDYDLVSLLIGVNNQYQGRSLEACMADFRTLLQTAIDLAGGDKSKVFVVSIPDYGFTPFGASNQAAITAEINAFNDAEKAIAAEMGIRYFDITLVSRFTDTAGWVAEDGLHPSGNQYAAWVEVMLDGVAEMLAK